MTLLVALVSVARADLTSLRHHVPIVLQSAVGRRVCNTMCSTSPSYSTVVTHCNTVVTHCNKLVSLTTSDLGATLPHHPVVPLQVPKFPSQRLPITKLFSIVLKTIECEVKDCNRHKTGQYLEIFSVKLSS